MTKRYSLLHELKKSRVGGNRLSNQPVAIWPMTLQSLRYWWDQGEDTELETAFFEPFHKDDNPDPLGRRVPP